MLSKTEILSPSSNYDRKHIFLSNMGLVVTSALHTYQLKDKMISINDRCTLDEEITERLKFIEHMERMGFLY